MHESEPVILIWSEILKEEDKGEEEEENMMLFHQIILHNYRKHECSDNYFNINLLVAE
jgi:hypothetical protein